MVHILPMSWTWPGFEGKSIPVWVYSNADAVELFLNGRSLGVKHFPADDEFVDHYVKGGLAVTIIVNGQQVTKKETPLETVPHVPSVHVSWSVPYEPGELKAVASKNGQVVATDVVRTAGLPARITLTPDRNRFAGDGQDLAFVKVTILDKDGNVCPNADDEIHFQLAGRGAFIAGVGNGDAINHESFQGNQHRAFHGLALAILRSNFGGSGEVKLTASAAGLTAATASFVLEPAP